MQQILSNLGKKGFETPNVRDTYLLCSFTMQIHNETEYNLALDRLYEIDLLYDLSELQQLIDLDREVKALHRDIAVYEQRKYKFEKELDDE